MYTYKPTVTIYTKPGKLDSIGSQLTYNRSDLLLWHIIPIYNFNWLRNTVHLNTNTSEGSCTD